MTKTEGNFDKYDKKDAYHWNLSNPAWTNGKYNPPTAARFKILENLLPNDASQL